MITVISWFSPNLLNNTNYNHGDEIDGDELKALFIVQELFTQGLNVIIKRVNDGIIIGVSDGGFGQR